MYNYNQPKIDDIDNRINLLQQQKNALMSYQPPIQQTFIQSSPAPVFDFNGKWVDSIEEAKKVANDNLPLVIFDRTKDRFYMKQIDGSMTAYEFKEIVVKDQKDQEIDDLKKQLASIQKQIEEIKEISDESIIQTNVQSCEPSMANPRKKQSASTSDIQTDL